MAECLAHVALGGATVLAWLGAGSLLSLRARVGDRLLDGLNRVGIGAVAFALATFAAGWAGVLHRWLYLSVFAVAAAGGAWALLRLARPASLPQLRSFPLWQLALVALLAFHVGLVLLAACAPVSSPDALLYHAADPRLFAEEGRIFEIPWNSSSYEPFTVQMLVLNGFLLWNAVQGAFAPLLLGLLTLAAVVGAAGRIAGRSVGLLAGAIFFAQPFMTWEVTSVFVEPGLAAAVALASWNLYRFVRYEERQALVLAGVFVGAAAGMKYLGLIAGLAFGVAALILLWRRLRLATALAFALPALLVALPWYLKNALLTGNPFYPHLFGGLNPSAAEAHRETMEAFGHGRSPVDFLLLPLRLLGDAQAFDGGEFLSPLFLMFAPLALLPPRVRRPALGVWAGVLLFVGAWFLTTQQARFLVPIMPVLAVLAALGMLAAVERGRAARVIVTTVTGLSLALGAAASAVYAAQFGAVVAGAQTEREFLRESASYYRGAEWLSEHLTQEDRVLVSFGNLLYLEVPYLTFGTHGDLLPRDAGPDETRAFVAREEVTHVAVLSSQLERRRQVEHLDARLLARVPTRAVLSRTRGARGEPRELLVYELEGS